MLIYMYPRFELISPVLKFRYSEKVTKIKKISHLLLNLFALSFYGSKMILDHPNHFGRAPIILDRSNLFWSGPNNFQNINISPIWTCSKWFIWTRPIQFVPDQNHFGPIEGRGNYVMSNNIGRSFSNLCGLLRMSEL